jgi:cell division protein FtsB
MIWAILRHWRLVVATAALAGLFYGGWWARGYVERVDDLRASNAALREDLMAARQTAEVMRAHYDRQEKTRQTLKALADEINSVKGRNAPLPPYLDNSAGKLWP